MTLVINDAQRLAELYENGNATVEEVKHLAEAADNARRRAGVKTLRDEFAMSALTGILANPQDKGELNVAVLAYVLAEAMLEARK